MTIRGKADPVYAGKVIRLYTYTDYITNFVQKETEDTIGRDGFFQLSFQSDYTQPVLMKINHLNAQLLVQPDFVYGITVPPVDSSRIINADVDLPLNIGIVGHDTTELNQMVFDFQEQYNKLFTTADERYLSRASMFRRVDSLQKACTRRYANINNDYFKRYMFYELASVNASLSRGEKYLFEVYIRNQPILYWHKGYMDFFCAYFKGYLARAAAARKGESLYHIINTKGDYATLLNFVRYEKDLRNDSLRELVILRELWDYHFSSEFSPEAVEHIVSQLQLSTKIAEHRQIASNMMAFFRKLQQGSPAPAFTVMNRDKKMLTLSNFKGRWIYLNFFSTTNPASLMEMPKIAALKKKLGDKLIFLSVCLDDSVQAYFNYLKQNPKFDWYITFNHVRGLKSTAKEQYNITGTEGYFLIDNLGNLSASPALSPSKGIEFRLNTIFKIRQRTTKTGLR